MYGVFYVANRNNTLHSKSYVKRNIHVAYIINGGKIISISSNSLRSMSGIDYNHRYTTDSTCHAEMGCIKNIKQCNRNKIFNKKLVMYSLSFKVVSDNDGNIFEYKLQSGKPCRSCAYNLLRYNIKKVWYSNNNSEIKALNLDNNVASTSVISSGSIIKLDFNKIYFNCPSNIFDIIKDNKFGTLILSRKDTVFKIGMDNIVLFQYYNKETKKVINCKVCIIEIKVSNTYHMLIKNMNKQFINMYKNMLKKTKTYIMIKFTKIN